MRCDVCGGRGTTGFEQAWKVDEQGGKVGGKPIFVHTGCKHLLKNVKYDAKPISFLPERVRRALARKEKVKKKEVQHE